MASVHSGFSLSIISGSGFFIAFYLRVVGAAQADNAHRRAGFGEDQSMKAVADITDGEKAVFAVAAGRYDHGRGPIEFVGERERQASFPDVLRVFRRVELDPHYLIVDTNKWTVNDNRQGFRSRIVTEGLARWFCVLRGLGW